MQPTVVIATPGQKVRNKWTNHDLPYGTYRNWSLKFIPSYLTFVGVQRDPFLLTGEDIVAPMQLIWNTIYPTIGYEIKPRCAVFDLVNPTF
jgi:hypothetical protein